MKNEKMLRAIGQIDDDLIEDAVIRTGRKKQPLYKRAALRRAVTIAACFVLLLGLALSMPTWLNPNNEGPGVPIEPGVAVNPGTLLPPSVQGDGQRVSIRGLDQLSYYAAVRMIEGTPQLVNQSMRGGNYGITLLASDYDTDKREEFPDTETTGPDETQIPPAVGEDIYYYALDPNEPFYINKVSMFQIELTDENGFLASKLGLGIVDVVILENCIWGENMITFRNGDNFFSCLSDGGGIRQLGFSTHKFVEGFFIVKNIEQENYGFYVDVDELGQAIAFHCGERENGGDRVDQNVKVVSTTVISNESRCFTVAELEEYFNTGELPPEKTPEATAPSGEDDWTKPTAPPDDVTGPTTKLEFWVADSVEGVDLSKFQEKYGSFGSTMYYGSGYVPATDENGRQVDPEHCVIYIVTSYPDYSSKEQHVTGIEITDPNVEFYGITLRSSIPDVMELLRQQGFEISEYGEEWVFARKGSVWINFYAEYIYIGVEVTNDTGMIF